MSEMSRVLARQRRAPLRLTYSALIGALAVTLLSACLVTNKVDYDEPIIPSQVERLEPLSEFSVFPLVSGENCNGAETQMQFVVAVSDLNLDEELEIDIRVNGVFARTDTIPSNRKRQREPWGTCLSKSRFRKECNLVEMVVSSDFVRNTSEGAIPAEPGDIAVAHWWVIGSAADVPNATYLDCLPPDGGVP